MTSRDRASLSYTIGFCEKVVGVTTSALLKPDQKFIILNQYIVPMLMCLLQNTPLPLITLENLEGVDMMIRMCIKD